MTSDSLNHLPMKVNNCFIVVILQRESTWNKTCTSCTWLCSRSYLLKKVVQSQRPSRINFSTERAHLTSEPNTDGYFVVCYGNLNEILWFVLQILAKPDDRVSAFDQSYSRIDELDSKRTRIGVFGMTSKHSPAADGGTGLVLSQVTRKLMSERACTSFLRGCEGIEGANWKDGASRTHPNTAVQDKLSFAPLGCLV